MGHEKLRQNYTYIQKIMSEFTIILISIGAALLVIVAGPLFLCLPNPREEKRWRDYLANRSADTVERERMLGEVIRRELRKNNK